MSATFTPWGWDVNRQRYYCYTLLENGDYGEIVWANARVDESVPRTPATPTEVPLAGQISPESPQGQYRTVPTSTQPESRSPYEEVSRSQPQSLTSVASYQSYPSITQSANSTYPHYPSQGQPANSSYPPYASQSQSYGNTYPTAQPAPRPLPPIVQQSVGGDQPQRFIRTGQDHQETERLDPRYRRVAANSQAAFFKQGRVFKMLWIEPAGMANPGRTRGSTHFSTVKYGEQAFSEIRRFVVVRNCGTFSQCIPIHTYRGRGATKPGLQAHLHGVIHTSHAVPPLLEGEHGFVTKQPVRVISSPPAYEPLEPQSRVNYGKPYAVEHNVKVLDIGMIWEGHLYLIDGYFTNAMTKGV